MTLLLVLNVIAGAAAGAAYGLWALKWAQRRAWTLAILNFVVGVIALGFAVGYALILVDHAHQPQPALVFRPFIPPLLLVPAVARWLELRRDEYREAYATALARQIDCRQRERGDAA